MIAALILLLASSAWAGVCTNTTATCQTTGKVTQSVSGSIEVAVSSASSTTAVIILDGTNGISTSKPLTVNTSSSTFALVQISSLTVTNQLTYGSLTQTCGAGYTSTNLGCIETAEHGSDTYRAASTTCYALSGRLPTYQEWYVAASSFTLTDEADEWELSAGGNDAAPYVYGNAVYYALAVGNDYTTAYAYRCFIPK